MSLNQREFRNWRFSTLAEIKAVANGNDQTLAFCDQTETLYKWDSASGATADDKYILATGAGGATRWEGISGTYALHANAGVNLGFGASVGAGDVGKYFQPHGVANGGKFTTLTSESQVACPIPGTLAALSWEAAATPTNAVLKIWKNGVVVATITISASSGVDTSFSVAVAAGDLIALEFDDDGSGLAMGKSVFELFVRGG